MLGLGLLPLVIVTLLWASALRRAGDAHRKPVLVARCLTGVAVVLSFAGAAALLASFDAASNASASTRATALSRSVTTSVSLFVVAYAAQGFALVTVVVAWFRRRTGASG